MVLNILCEYFDNPIGIDNSKPRFSWKYMEETKGHQKCYRIVVSSDPDLKSVCWDSGEVRSDNTLNITYAGEELKSVSTYYYQVFTETSFGEHVTSEKGHFTTGLLKQEDWKAKWEGIPGMDIDSALCRMSLELNYKPQKAYSFVISPNYNVFTVNGRKTTDSVLNNANTDPEKRTPYLMEDITDLLTVGENVFGIELGNGWPGLTAGLNHGDGISEHQFSVQYLFLDDEGNKQWYYTKPSEWKFTNETPVISNSIYGGEEYDARKEIHGWNTPEYQLEQDQIIWNPMVEFEGFANAVIVSQRRMEQIGITQFIRPTMVYQLDDGSYTYDFGQNFAGWVRLTVNGKAGEKITLSYAEVMNDDHSINKLSLRQAKAVDAYILKGKGVEVYEPRFTFHGFRYVNISGFTETPDADAVIGCFVRSDIQQTGTFECSDNLLNQLYSNVSWTEASNQHGLPTDCPQRDERLGWTNDMTVRNETALYSFDVARLYEKWMADIRDAQGKQSGAYTDTAPYLRYGARPQDPVAASPVLIPWNVYRFYDDRKIVTDNYEANKKWVAYLQRNAIDYIMPYSHMGDWAGPLCGTIANVSDKGVGGGAVSVITPTTMVATAYFYYMHILMGKQAELLEKKEEKEQYLETAEKIKEAFIRNYYNKEQKYFCTNSQGANVIALYFGLVPEEDIDDVMKNLVEDIVVKNDTHLTTGNLCSRYILEVLFRYGYTDIAYELMAQDTYPSWGYMVRRGATTMWERWEEILDPDSLLAEMASCNHPMNGAFGVAFHKYLGGISPDDERPGFKNIIIKPYIPEKLKCVRCSMNTLAGEIESEWYKKDGRLYLSVRVPFNSTADIYVPSKGIVSEGEKVLGTAADGYFKVHVQAGGYQFVSEI